MCGICGYTSRKDIKLVTEMTELLKHRGPDSSGFYVDEFINLGMRRLAVIDLDTGEQPIYNEDKSLVLICNGEIYNFKELKEQLKSKGHKFSTNTDVEVIVHLYEEKKENCVKYLCGMFAFAIWDRNNRQLFLARDRLGIKPLYYSLIPSGIVFSSEIKPILLHPEVSKEIDISKLDLYFNFLYIPNQTIYKDICQLLPSSYLIFKDNRVSVNTYWQLSDQSDEEKSLEYYLDAFEDLFNIVVRQHLISDVPFSVFLSGGIDSSLVSIFAARLYGSKINTFTIGYSQVDYTYNELNKAKFISNVIGSNHVEHTVDTNVFNILSEIVYGFEQPFADSSAVVNYIISKLAREHCKVALSGLGGDELFAGYPRYLAFKLSRFLPKIEVPKNLLEFIPESYSSSNLSGRLKRFLNSLKLSSPVEKYLSYISFLREEKQNLYSCKFFSYLNEDVLKFHKSIYEESFLDDFLKKILYLDIKTYLVDDLLFMADRMSMLNSLELRVPFCDHRIVEFAFKIPSKYKIKGLTLKYFTKKLLLRYLPKKIVNQKKMGFMIPLARWLARELSNEVVKFIKIRKYKDYFNYDYIEKIYQLHLKKKKNYSDILWALLVFDRWVETFDIKLPKITSNYKPKVNIDERKQNFLLINIAGIGDFVASIPYLAALKEYYPNSKITLVVSDKAFLYAKNCPYVDEVYFFPVRKSKVYINLEKFLKLVFNLRKKYYDFVVNFYEISTVLGAFKMWLFLSLLKAKKFIGRNTNSLGFFYDVKIKDKPKKDKLSQYEYYRNIILSLGVPEELVQKKEEKTEETLWISNEAKYNVDKLLSEEITTDNALISINPSSDRKTRLWFSERFAYVCNKLYEKYKFKFAILGEKKDLKIAQEIKNFLNFEPIILCGKTTIDELILIIKRSRLLITTNSLAMHIAGLVNTPLVGLMGSGDIHRDKPFSQKSRFILLKKQVVCSPCYHYECPKRGESYMMCMKNIKAEEVLKAAECLLNVE